ncbi:MAG: FAD-dependent monooxygenase [Cyclobacteriaceae bacterium]|jgi:flavin-dependent dehydrogenase|nr:FAD-dependent monooxygenase [Cyclobacteriaceae bacterium]
MEQTTDVIIIGGGLGGLVAALDLRAKGYSCILIEKKKYPFHRVCGEYISNEIIPYLKSLQAFPESIKPSKLSRFQLTATNGKSSYLNLDMGGFGISRYQFDFFLYQLCLERGVTVLHEEAENVQFQHNGFIVQTEKQKLLAKIVIGAFGKRSKLDVTLNRQFIKKRSPYVGVKYHVKADYPNDLIALHNFEGGYCGISQVENNVVNICYLVHRNAVKKAGSISQLEQTVLYKNPWLEKIFSTAEHLYEKPETINEITFETKETVANHILFIGDSAGMITPLCGNGMAMAMHSAKLAAEHIHLFLQNKISRNKLEENYTKNWKKTFAARLWRGRQIQKLFGSVPASNLAIQLIVRSKPLAKIIMRSTHGDYVY